jgi:hypothetical protein
MRGPGSEDHNTFVYHNNPGRIKRVTDKQCDFCAFAAWLISLRARDLSSLSKLQSRVSRVPLYVPALYIRLYTACLLPALLSLSGRHE